MATLEISLVAPLHGPPEDSVADDGPADIDASLQMLLEMVERLRVNPLTMGILQGSAAENHGSEEPNQQWISLWSIREPHWCPTIEIQFKIAVSFTATVEEELKDIKNRK